MRRAHWPLLAAAVAALSGCAHLTTEAAATPPPAVLSDANKAKAYAVGLRLAAQDRAADAAHRAEMARLIAARVLQVQEHDRTLRLRLRLRNKSAKSIRSIGAGLEVRDPAGRRLGLAEVDGVPFGIPARGAATRWVAVRYLRFGEDAGTMRMAAGKPKRIHLRIIEIKYADGSDAGYDD